MAVFEGRVNWCIFSTHSRNDQKSFVLRTFLSKKQHSGAACTKSGQEFHEVQEGEVKSPAPGKETFKNCQNTGLGNWV